jgi:hypothetical protein
VPKTCHNDSKTLQPANLCCQVFIVLGIVVNVGGNSTGHYIGGENWHIPGAPFVDGFKGFASVFVTASFACESFFDHHRMIPIREC